VDVIVSAAGERAMAYTESYQCDVCGDKKGEGGIGGWRGWTASREKNQRKISL
jgi:hypothetical protein